MKPRLLVCSLCLLFGPITSVASARFDASNPKLAAVERQTESIRHLKPLHAVKVTFLGDGTFNAAFDAAAHRDTPESEVALSQRELTLIGLLAKTDDLHQILFQNLSPQVGGFYDDHRKALFVRNHGSQVLGIRRDLIAHEYTHALQDQHYDLRKLNPNEVKFHYRNTDIPAAHKALIEGDAVNTQYLFISRRYSRSEIQAFLNDQAHLPKTPPLPKSIQREFNFQYTDGLSFVQKLYSNGGMAAVDAAYRRLPDSTYEVMHPLAYAKHWRPISVSLHEVRGFENWKRTDDDVFGAFGYKLLLWQFLPERVARSVTDHYRGDRYVFLENGSKRVMLFKSVWSGADAAASARDALTKALRTHYPAARVVNRTGTTVTDANGGVFLRADGKHLTVSYATAATLAQQAGRAATS